MGLSFTQHCSFCCPPSFFKNHDWRVTTTTKRGRGDGASSVRSRLPPANARGDFKKGTFSSPLHPMGTCIIAIPFVFGFRLFYAHMPSSVVFGTHFHLLSACPRRKHFQKRNSFQGICFPPVYFNSCILCCHCYKFVRFKSQVNLQTRNWHIFANYHRLTPPSLSIPTTAPNDVIAPRFSNSVE